MADLKEQLQLIADFVEDKKPHATKRRIKIFAIGVGVGFIISSLTFLAILYENPKKYVTYATFYIQERNGIRPASIIIPNKLETTNDLEAIESMLMKKYDTQGKISNIMLFGAPMRLLENRDGGYVTTK
jgi:hypothetical protein